MKIIAILFILFLCTLISGCETWPIANYKEQIAIVQQDFERNCEDIRARMIEVNKSYEAGKITEGEYLLLKNNLKKELNDYKIEADRKVRELGQECDYQINELYR